ncbi:MAG: DUF58 domain-containing protein [Gemmatimonadota bacterium]
MTSRVVNRSRGTSWLWAGAALAVLTTFGLIRREALTWLLGLDLLWLIGLLFDVLIGFVPIPSRRWLLIGAGLALLAPAGLLVPDIASILLVLDAVWVGVLLVDALRIVEPGRILVQREAPPAFSVGRRLPVSYVWTNRNLRPVTLLAREEFPEPLGGPQPDSRRLNIPAEGHTREQLDVLPAHRGKGSGGRLDLRLSSPLGLSWRQTRLTLPWDATVYPSLIGASIRALPTQATRRREAGFRNIRRLGEGRVFETLKEWVPGDDTRTIDWKATARRGKVMARQYEDERRQQVLLVIDAGRAMTAESDGVSRLESVITAALHLAHSAVEHDDNVGLMVFADEVQTFITPGRGRRALRAVLDGLAGIEGKVVEPNYPAAFSQLAQRNRKRALTVVFTDVIDRTASEALVAQVGSLRPRHLPLAVTLRDPALEALSTRRPANNAEAFERAAAEELLGAREEALAEMRRKGVLILDVLPRRAAEAVVEQYAQLKRRGLL